MNALMYYVSTDELVAANANRPSSAPPGKQKIVAISW